MNKPRELFLTLLASLLASVIPVAATAASGFFEAGAYVIDMGQSTQTIGNALRPYGLVYDLVTNYKVPVNWAINPAKTTFRLDAGDPIPVDFVATITTGTKIYGGGSFIIDAPFLTQPVIDAINTWKAQGVIVDTLAAPLTTEIYGQVTRFPRAVLDAQNANLAVAYFVNAGVPDSAYHVGLPTTCDDVYILTPADLKDRPAADHQALYDFVINGGGLWAGGHSVSDLENLFVGATQLNFLSNGLVLSGSHNDGTTPYSYNPAAANDPIMQIMNRLDAATQNGSEQIYVPNSLWRSATTVAVFDPDHPDNPAGGTAPFNKAAVLAYGYAYGDPSKGLVMYEGGDSLSLSGNAAANIAAQRAFFNFLLTEGILRTPQPTVSIPTFVQGQPATLTATISGGSGSYSYVWVSSNGGVFSAPTGTWSVGDPPITTQYTMTGARDTVRLLVTDIPCGRLGFYSTNLGNTKIVSIAKVDDAAEPATNGKFRLTLSGGPSLTATNISYSVTGTATSGIDYAALTGTVPIPAGAAAADIDVTVLDDSTVEATETVVIQLISSDNPAISIDILNDTATVQISDNDNAVYTINDATVNEGAGTMTFTISVSNAVDIPVAIDVHYTDQSASGAPGGVGADYDNDPDQVTFAASDTADKTVTVAITNDAIIEANETFLASLSTATVLGGRSVTTSDQGTGRIVNDDAAPPTLSINSVSANEGNSGLTPFVFTVTLSASSASTITVNFATADGTATAGSDYVATSGTLTFNPGILTQTITVNVNGDTTVEPNETFLVNLSGPTNATIATATGTGTIVNDDVAPTPPAANIPTLTEGSLLFLALVLALLASGHIRRRRAR